MKKKAPIVYYGNDPDLIKEMEHFLSTHPELELCVEDYSPSDIIGRLTKKVPLIIIVDFSCLTVASEILEEIIFYKRMFPYNSTLFAGIFASKAALTELSLIFSSGFQLSLVKGCEADLFFRDLLQMTTLEEGNTHRFAQARDINCPLSVGICSSVSRITENDYTIETDLPPHQDSLRTVLPFIAEANSQVLKVIEQIDAGYLYPMSSLCKVQHPFASPWDTVTDEMLDPETIKTWMSDNQDSLTPCKDFIKVISSNRELVLEVFKKSESIPFHIDWSFEVSKNWEDELKSRRPALIFFDIDAAEDSKIPMIEMMISLIKMMEDYSPIIIIARTNTSGPAFQKLLNYPMLLCLPDIISLQMITDMASRYKKKKGEATKDLNSFTLSVADPRRTVDAIFEPMINHLTEHSIDFTTNLELPYYTVLHFKIPLDFYATIIPIKAVRTVKENFFSYHGLIHGLDEKQVNKLRQFVNQLIYSPITDFSVASMKKASEIKIPEEKLIIPAIIHPPAKAEMVEWNEARKHLKGKSKL